MTTPRFDLISCTATLLRKIADPQIKQRSVAMTYAFALRSNEQMDWPKINQAIVKRWSRSGLVRIKGWAWSGKSFREEDL